MSNKLVLALLFSISSLFANDVPTEKVQILAENLNNQGTLVRASGDVLIFSPTYYITAKEVIYNKKKKTLELFHDVNILKNNSLLSVSDYAFIDFKNDTRFAKPILLLDKKSNLWIKSLEARQEKDMQYFKSSTLSSCDCDSPLWSIDFSSGSFNSKEKVVDIYNSRLKLGSLPMFYLPWFRFSTNMQRRTGLLQPNFSYDKTEGFAYSQSLFIAPEKSWDLELTPQYRAKRGAGLYSVYRNVWQYSNLNFKSGYFKEQNSYKIANDINNISHYGYGIEYSNHKVLGTSNTQDGLFISLNNMNDIGYKSMEELSLDIDNTSNNIITSKVDYFYNTNNYFGSSEFRYFKDVKIDANQDTILQQLPKIKLHSYSKNIFDTSIMYSTNLTYINQTKKDGIKAQNYNISMPFSYSFTLFDEYINVKLQEQISSSYIKYDNTKIYKDATFTENKHIITVSTDLIKPYDEYLHTFNIQSTITMPNTVKEKGDIYFTEEDNSDLKEFALTKSKKNVNLSLNQSLFNKFNLKEIVNHKINQSIIYDENSEELGDLSNELAYNYLHGTLSNKIIYNHDTKMVISSSTELSYKKNNLFLKINHTDKTTAETVNLEVGNKFNRYYSIKYKENYNLDNHTSNIKEYSLDINKRCWGLNIKVANNLIAAPTSTNEAIKQEVVYLLFTMKPIGKFQQQYELNQK